MKMTFSSSITKKPKYTVNRTNKWSDELESIYGQIANREKFSYDMNNDAFYKQYAQQYANNAKLAMQDTVAQASALTGGYANSYAATAGQAMYNRQMEGLNDRATELYNLALQTYNVESDRLNSIYSMTANNYALDQDRINSEIAEAQWQAEFDESQRQYNENMAYQRQRDSVADYQWNKTYNYNAQRDAVADSQWQQSFDYGKERDLVSDSQWQQSFDYNANRDSVEDARWEKQFEYQQQRDAVSDSQFAKEMAYKYAALNDKNASSKSISKTEYERTVNSLPNDLRLYLNTGATQGTNNSDEIRQRRVTALQTAVERNEDSVSEETAKKLLQYWGYDY